MIELRSDTATKPSPAMREAMANAEVGDEQRREDPTVNELERLAAALLGQDEAVYLLQADTIRHGHLFPPAAADGSATLPWLSAQVGHHYVPKYTPVWPAMISSRKE